MEQISVIFTILLLMSSAAANKKHFVDMNPKIHPDLKKEGVKIPAKINEFLEITCPQYDRETPKNEMLLFYLYELKDYEDYESCTINDTLKVLSCDTPYITTKLTLKFQKTSPYPLGFTFQDGKSYYYIAIPKGATNCKQAMRLTVSIEKELTVVPPIEPVTKKHHRPRPKSTAATTRKTTTTTTTTIVSTTRTKYFPGNNDQGNAEKITGDDPGNGATTTRQIQLLSTLLVLLTIWINA